MNAVVSLLVVLLVSSVSALDLFDCPLGWEAFEERCYQFIFYPTRRYEEATLACQVDGASLLSVNSQQEHEFISAWLTRYDINRNNKWWTSGIGSNQDLHWEGDGTSLLQAEEYWITPADRRNPNQHIVYRYSTKTNTFAWGRESASTSLSLICEISLNEAYMIVQAGRDYSYGTDAADERLVEKGPKFSIVPTNLIILGKTRKAFLECIAGGTPLPTYTWTRKDVGGRWVEVTSMTNGRYILTNGKLTFTDPKNIEDEGDYQCHAENKKGVILSDPVKVSFGYLNEVSKVPPGAVSAPLYQGTVINCNPPGFKPVVRYQWFRNSTAHFIRPSLNHYFFISHNGKLYFSETQQSDAGDYFCVITLSAPPGNAVSSSQPPSRISLGIQLLIAGETASDFGPTIHNDFPAVFPSPPLRGENIRIECMAYGRLPLYYTWEREGSPMPGSLVYSDHNRVITIVDAHVEDGGRYTCRVSRGSASSDAKTIYLNIESKPYFIFPLKNQHVDVGSQLTWRCEVLAKPRARYAWYKDGQPLKSIAGDVTVNENVIVIKSVDPAKHSGMYQCAAENKYGTTFSSAELRVLEFAPTFSKQPVDASLLGTIGGNKTIICQPEAAPRPEVTWKKNGRELGLTVGTVGHLQVLNNGNLLINEITTADAGLYECITTNYVGTASSSGMLTVVDRTVLSIVPVNTRVIQNSTAFFICQASFDRRSRDLVYIWYFNNVIIDHDNDPHFDMGRRDSIPGLYVKNAEYKHEGKYTCTAQTVQDKAAYTATLTVLGPPGEPAGVFAAVTGTAAHVTWTLGDNNGDLVVFFTIEFKTDYRPIWRVFRQGIPNHKAIDQVHPDRRTADLFNLSPGSSYHFRVRAANRYGMGTPSVASPIYKIPSSPPVKAPSDVGGGGGTVGALVITWEPLDAEDHNGNTIGYKIYYRPKASSFGTWQHDKVSGLVGKFVTTVGTENYYLEYEVMVAAFNSLGEGPNSTISIVLSAEDMPTVTPTNLNGDSFNGTAIMAFWDPVTDTREVMKGRVQGYQVNFYMDGEDDPTLNSINYYGQRDGGLVIGLVPDGDYWVNVQVFNTAGLGPRGEEYRISTFTSAPFLYPRFVEVHSKSADSVSVRWQGISTGLLEETLLGYKMRYWEASGDLVTAKDALTEGKETYGVISGIEKGVVYKLRVLGHNWGGDGKKSPPVYFTLGGEVRYDPSTTMIMATGQQLLPSQIFILMFLLITLAWV